MNACTWWACSRPARACAGRSPGRARGANNYHGQMLAVALSYNLICTYGLVWLNARFTDPTANYLKTYTQYRWLRRARPGS
eukprot:7493683-Pyramimonas_sp.AAC.1